MARISAHFARCRRELTCTARVQVAKLYTSTWPAHTAPIDAFIRRLLTGIVFTLLSWGAAAQSGPDPDDLPDIGSPAEAALSLEDEYQIGRMIVRGLRDSDQIVEDPEVSEYIRSVGLRLSSQANDGSQRFNFFMVRDSTINAFA